MNTDTATAVRFTGAPDSQGFPPAAAWKTAPPLRFDADWQGKNPDALRETEVRLLWTCEALYLRFRARYRNINVFSDAEPNGRRDQLWDRDVVETFLQPDSSDGGRYKEFEISPNGFWIDLDIAPGEKRDLQSALKRRVQINENEKLWVAELSIPMKSLVARFDHSTMWRANFYRVEGPTEPRFYSAWRPTGTPQPNFHVPKAFGRLIFVEPPPPHTIKNDAITRKLSAASGSNPARRVWDTVPCGPGRWLAQYPVSPRLRCHANRQFVCGVFMTYAHRLSAECRQGLPH